MKYVLKDEFFTYHESDDLREIAEMLNKLRDACCGNFRAKIYTDDCKLLTVHVGRPLRDYFKMRKAKGKKANMEDLILIDRDFMPYGDNTYFVGEDGVMYDDYISIGD